MSIVLDSESLASANNDDVLHSIPCKIDYDGTAKVAEYFTSAIRETALKTDGSVKSKLSAVHIDEIWASLI